MGLIYETYELLEEIVSTNPENFSGIGLVVYDSKKLDRKSHCDLRPNIKTPQYSIHDKGLVDYLIHISDYHNTLHDGFHMMNESGVLTHVAQYFVPPIVENLAPDQDHGVRVHSSICGSTLQGVLFIAVVCSNSNIYLFQDGKKVNELVEGKMYVK